jgi:hypothetical protein
MDIRRVIQDLILKNDTVSVPGLGKITRQYTPAEVLSYSGKVTPPSFKLIFEEVTTDSDNTLTQTLAEEYDTTQELSEQTIEGFVTKLISTLDAGKSYFIKEIGTFKKVNGKIEFEAERNSILLADSFGLESTKLPLIEIDNHLENKGRSRILQILGSAGEGLKGLKKWLLPAAIVLLIIGLGVGLFYTGYLQKGYNSVNDWVVNFMSPSTNKQLSTNDTLHGKIDANELKRKALKYSEEKEDTFVSQEKADASDKVIRYYIIAGSFKDMTKAEKRKEQLIKSGYQPEVLVIHDTIFRVSLASYIVRKEAVEEFIKISTSDSNMKIWLYSQLVKEN